MVSALNKTKAAQTEDGSNAGQQVLVLRAANRVAHLLSKTQRVEEAIEELMAEFLNLVEAEEGSIQLLRPGSGKTQRTLIRKGKSGKGVLETYLDDLMTGWAVKNKQTLLTNDIVSTFKLGKTSKQFSEVSSALSAPFLIQEQVVGAVNLIRTGKIPFSTDEQKLVASLAIEVSEFIEQAQLREQLFDENERLKQELKGDFDTHGIIGNSPAMKAVFSLLQRVTPTDGRVMIQGESGTGKELIAKFIHHEGRRRDKSFVAIDCGALPANLLESELFGYVRGAFTGANRDRRGLFEEANNGTIFLDEIANMSLETQAKLLRVLQEGEIRPLGSNEMRKVDTRVIAAASHDLSQKISAGEFRSDLFYRLNVVPIRLPSLRERVEDIPVLALHFLKRFVEKYSRQLRNIDPGAIEILERYPWPGNVRELENVIERGVILAAENDTKLSAGHLPFELSSSEQQTRASEIPLSGDLTKIIEDYEREILHKVLQNNDWNQTQAANALNISERVIRYKIKRLNLHPPS